MQLEGPRFQWTRNIRMAASVSDIARVLETWAPRATAQSYDNVGLQVGRASREVTRAVIALDLTPDVVAEAKAMHAELIVTHHPLLFKGVKSVTPDAFVSGLVLDLAESGIALYSIHTNLDAARNGVSFGLAERLGLKDISFMTGMDDAVRKIATFVPVDHVDAVHEAMAAAGAGRIGAYEACSFRTGGTGTFRPTTDAQPFIGSAGGSMERVTEVRLEMEFAAWLQHDVVQAMKHAHPYEEVAFDIMDIRKPYRDAGLGAIGSLARPEALRSFLDRVTEALDAPTLRYAGDLDASIQRVAVCGGSGSDFIDAALSSDAHAYVTADVTYHRYFDVLGSDGTPRMALIDPGHYETERLTEDLLRDHLSGHFPDITWHVTGTRTAPVHSWIGSSFIQ